MPDRPSAVPDRAFIPHSFQLVDDPSGNSFIENLLAPKADPDREVTYYTRTEEQDHALGIYEQNDMVNTVEPAYMVHGYKVFWHNRLILAWSQSVLAIYTLPIGYYDYHPVTKSPKIGSCDYSQMSF